MDTTRMGIWCCLDYHYDLLLSFYGYCLEKSVQQEDTGAYLRNPMGTKCVLESIVLLLSLDIIRIGNHYRSCLCGGLVPIQEYSNIEVQIIIDDSILPMVTHCYIIKCLCRIHELARFPLLPTITLICSYIQNRS